MGAPFVIVFLAAGLPGECGATLNFLRTLLVSLPMTIHQQLKAFYLVHPTLMLRIHFTVAGIALWGKLHFLDYLHDLVWPDYPSWRTCKCNPIPTLCAY